MIQYAVAQKNGIWTVFQDGQVLFDGISRSAAIESAQSLAFDAETAGETVEFLVQGYYGELVSRISGGNGD